MSTDAHQEVIWLDVSVNEVLVVDILDPANHLEGIVGHNNPKWPLIDDRIIGNKIGGSRLHQVYTIQYGCRMGVD